jgi:hypothetical protein
VWFPKNRWLPIRQYPAPGIAQRRSELLDEECAKQTPWIRAFQDRQAHPGLLN